VKTILLYAVMILPLALLMANLAGMIWYMQDHARYEHIHQHLPDNKYFSVLNEYEVVGGIIGGLPGLTILLTLKGLDAKSRRRASS
jgi:hypothetical protein